MFIFNDLLYHFVTISNIKYHWLKHKIIAQIEEKSIYLTYLWEVIQTIQSAACQC